MSLVKNITNSSIQDTVNDEHEVIRIGDSENQISKIKKSGSYRYIPTEVKGIYRIVNETEIEERYTMTDDYLVSINKGTQLVRNKRTGVYEEKYVTTQKKVSGWKNALKEKGISDIEREESKTGAPQIKNATIKDVIQEFKKNHRFYLDQTESYQVHLNNHFNHIVDFFGDKPVRKIKTSDIDKYFEYQKENGNRMNNSTEKGIHINTLSKHKTTLKQLWEYMLYEKVYGVTENVVKYSNIPKETIFINGSEKKVSRIAYHARELNLEEFLYTINDAIENEFDRSIALLIGLSALGSLRRGEIAALTIGDLDTEFGKKIVSTESANYGGFNKLFLEEHKELIVIDKQRMRLTGKEKLYLPKSSRIRVIGVCQPLRDIIDYYLEQRKELDSILQKTIKQEDILYNPIVNEIRGNVINCTKLIDRWREYQVRRNKRMEAKGLEPIPVIRLHDLRHTFANLAKVEVPDWQESLQLGHTPANYNTTKKVYWNDREPRRIELIAFLDKTVKIDWDKAMRKDINDNGQVRINGSGHLVFESETDELFRRLGKKRYLTAEEETKLIAGTYSVG